MHFFKRVLRGLTSSIYKSLIFLLAIVASFLMIVGTPATLKKLVNDSHIYDKVVDTVLAAASEEAKKSTDSLPVDRPEIQQAAKDAFPADFLRKSTESVIDGVYRWLDGDVQRPDFKIDLTKARDTFINALGKYSAERVEKLPVCTAEQVHNLNGSIDPFNVECVPPGTDPAKIREDVIRDLSQSEGFLDNPVITADSLSSKSGCEDNSSPQPAETPQGNSPKRESACESGKNVFDDAKAIPQIYRLAKLAPVLLGILALLFAAFLILLHDKKRDGVRSVGISTAGTGIFLLVNILLIKFLFDWANKSDSISGLNANTKDLLVSVLDSINAAINRTVIIFGIAYVAIGLIILGVLWLTRSHEKPEAPEEKDKAAPKPGVEDKDKDIVKDAAASAKVLVDDSKKPDETPKPDETTSNEKKSKT